MEKDRKKIISCILDIGERLLEAGAEVSRVEDTMQRIGLAYGFERIDVFTIISTINISAAFDGETYTQTRRIRKIGVDMEKIVRCNDLSRKLCLRPEPPCELIKDVEALDGVKQYSFFQVLAVYFIIAFAFTLFFGGSIGDGISAGIASLILRLIDFSFKKLNLHNFALYFINSFIVGLAIYILIGIGIGASYDRIAMGNIMLLIPGIGLTTSVRDMITGDMLSGILGFLAAVIQAIAIGLGFAAAAAIFIGI